MEETLDGIILNIGAWALGQGAWAALLLLASLAVGTAKKIEWAVRLGILAVMGCGRAWAWATTPKPVHPGVKAALACCGSEAKRTSGTIPGTDGDGKKHDLDSTFLTVGRLKVGVPTDERWMACVYLDEEGQSGLFSDVERQKIAKAARAEIARREKEAKAKAEADRLRDRQALADILAGAASDPVASGCGCADGSPCLCGPSCGCDHCGGCPGCDGAARARP